MAIAIVQSKAVENVSTGSTQDVVLDSTPTSGNILVAMVAARNTAAASIGWPGSGFWAVTKVQDEDTTSTSISQRWARTSEHTSATLQITIPVGRQVNMVIVEVSGTLTTGAVDKSASTDGVNGTSISTGSTGTLTIADQIAFACCAISGTNGGSEAISDSFTMLHESELQYGIFAYKIVSATTALNPSLSWATTRLPAACIATYMIASTSVQRGLGISGGIAVPTTGAVNVSGIV